MTRMSVRVIRRAGIQPTALSRTRKINIEKKVMRLLAGRYVLYRDILLTAISERVGNGRAERISNGTGRAMNVRICSARENLWLASVYDSPPDRFRHDRRHRY